MKEEEFLPRVVIITIVVGVVLVLVLGLILVYCCCKCGLRRHRARSAAQTIDHRIKNKTEGECAFLLTLWPFFT